MSNNDIFRKCIVTNKITNINKMIRIVRDKNNKIFLENDVHIQGRGAYIINDFTIIINVLEKKILNKTFKTNISNDVYNELKKEVNQNDKIKNKEQQKQK